MAGAATIDDDVRVEQARNKKSRLHASSFHEDEGQHSSQTELLPREPMLQGSSPSQNFLLPLNSGEGSKNKLTGVGKPTNFSSQS